MRFETEQQFQKNKKAGLQGPSTHAAKAERTRDVTAAPPPPSSTTAFTSTIEARSANPLLKFCPVAAGG